MKESRDSVSDDGSDNAPDKDAIDAELGGSGGARDRALTHEQGRLQWRFDARHQDEFGTLCDG